MQVVFLGLETLLPLMSLELLKFPKLSCLYFQLLAHMLEVSTWAALWQHSTYTRLLRLDEVHLILGGDRERGTGRQSPCSA